MWRDHYKELLNSNADPHEKDNIFEHLKSLSSHVGMQVIMLEFLQTVRNLLYKKFSGPVNNIS